MEWWSTFVAGGPAYLGGLVMGMPKYLCQACGIATTSQANLEDHKVTHVIVYGAK